ncbi:hypothetical protein RvY_14334 [Ramazzottius varieornatus]|uniref:Uncharacterized protein n=1 Tax=Ramazzottius varieornatus TaxID=947166 RepID=A0A1D1VQZ3_RAMVA|nr:hypothetical protein RvY_14334 [Ramazzottius varieornatus]
MPSALESMFLSNSCSMQRYERYSDEYGKALPYVPDEDGLRESKRKAKTEVDRATMVHYVLTRVQLVPKTSTAIGTRTSHTRKGT